MPRAIKVGVVTSNKMDKTVVVKVERLVRHKLYTRSFKKTSTFLAHDEGNQCEVGDRVRIIESRPLSRRKRWRVVNVVTKTPSLASPADNQAPEAAPEDEAAQDV
jgi:small subunit ribosomal protein S17